MSRQSTECGFLQFQLEKIYDPNNEEDDMIEMEEERLRMREHVMNEVCSCSNPLSAFTLGKQC